jgi:hypothetical protein
MPKDREKYRYIDVGLERGSWALAMFEEDARRHHMSDQPGKLMALRLTEYYERKKEQELPPSRESRVLIDPSGPAIPHTDKQDRGNSLAQAQEDTVLEISQQETENADEAADYWAHL